MLTKRRAYPRWLIRGLVLFTVGMTVFAALASREHNGSEGARHQLLSQYVALEARDAHRSDPAMAAQLALVAYRISPTPDAQSALLDTTAGVTTDTTALPASATPADPSVGQEALRRTRALTGVTSSALSPNGKLLVAAGADELLYLWDVTDPRAPKLAHKLAGPSSAMTHLALSPDGRRLAAATADRSVWLFWVGIPARASELARLSEARGTIRGLAFDQSHGTLLAADGPRRSTVWYLWPYQAIDHICGLALKRLTRSDWTHYVPQATYSLPCARWSPPKAASTAAH